MPGIAPILRTVWLASLVLFAHGAHAAEVQAVRAIAVVVPASAPDELLDADALAQIYKRRKLLWRDGSRIVPVNLPADSALRSLFSRAVLRQSPEQQEDYWNQQYFQGVLPPHVLESETAVLRFVAGTAHAVGYLSYCAVDASLRVVLVVDEQGRVLDADTRIDCAKPG